MENKFIYLYIKKNNDIVNEIHHFTCRRLKRIKKIYQREDAAKLEDLLEKLKEKGLSWKYCPNCPSQDIKSIADVICEIKEIAKTSYFPFDSHKLPKPYINNENSLKAFLLGCDPGNQSDGGKTRTFEYVFGLEDENSPYFARSIMPNIISLGLSLENLYVQNLCRNYFNIDTYKHKSEWKKCANLWMPLIRQELDTQDKDRNLPILITSDIIFEVILNFKKPHNKEIYKEKKIFDKDSNYFGRKLIALYRSPKYRLENPEFKGYIKVVKEEFEET